MEYGYEQIPLEDITDYFTDSQKFTMLPWEDRLGMTVTSGSVTLDKNQQNLAGISIGGGSPNCPCLYVVQVFDNTPAAKDGTLAAGDEIVGINGMTVKCRTKSEAARMIQSSRGQVSINYNKLHADPRQGKTLDLILKKVKHRVVENMTSGAADALGLSRAILCNDSLVKKLNELEITEVLYTSLTLRTKHFIKAFFNLTRAHRAFGDVFSGIGVREPLEQASLVFSKFGETHRDLEKNALNMIKVIKPMMNDLNTYLSKAIPDTKLTIKKYLDAKFEYLSYCLKVKEMDDEEYACNALNEYLYRVETGNYEYRLVLRCRQEARVKFAKLRTDVLVKLELLDNKRVQDMVFQLQRFVTALARCHADNHKVMKDNLLFPIEVDLSKGFFNYNTTGQMPSDGGDEEENIDGFPSFIPTIAHVDQSPTNQSGDGDKMENNPEETDGSFPFFQPGDQENESKLGRDLLDFFFDSPSERFGDAPVSLQKNVPNQCLDVMAELTGGFTSDKTSNADTILGGSTHGGATNFGNLGVLEETQIECNKLLFDPVSSKEQNSIYKNKNISTNDVRGSSHEDHKNNGTSSKENVFHGIENFDNFLGFLKNPTKNNNNSNIQTTNLPKESPPHISGDDDYGDKSSISDNKTKETTLEILHKQIQIKDDHNNNNNGDDNDLDEDLFFEALQSNSMSDKLIKDFMNDTRFCGENDDDDDVREDDIRSDKGNDNDDNMLEVSGTNDNDCSLINIISERKNGSIGLLTKHRRSLDDDVLIEDVRDDDQSYSNRGDDDDCALVCINSS